MDAENLIYLLVGVAFTALLAALRDWHNTRMNKRSLAIALKTEILFLAHVIDKRELANVLDRKLQELEDGTVKQLNEPTLAILNNWRKHEPIYTANIDKIGMLPKTDASRIVEFHELLNLVKMDQLVISKYNPKAQKIALRVHSKWLRAASELGYKIADEAGLQVTMDQVWGKTSSDLS